MMFYLEMDMNLLVYGVGSKCDLLEEFLQQKISPSYANLIIRGFNTGLMMRTVLQKIIEWIRSTIDRNRNKNSQNRKLNPPMVS